MFNLVDRWSGLIALIGAVIWLTAGFLGGQFGDGRLLVLGLSEQNYRALWNPALVCLLVGAVGLWRSQSALTGRLRSSGWALVALGLIGALSGNLLEFGPIGKETSFAASAWLLFLISWLFVAPVGALLITLAETRRPTLPAPGRVGMLALVIVAPGVFVDFGLTGVAFGVGWMLLGLTLVRTRSLPTARCDTRS